MIVGTKKNTSKGWAKCNWDVLVCLNDYDFSERRFNAVQLNLIDTTSAKAFAVLDFSNKNLSPKLQELSNLSEKNEFDFLFIIIFV